MSDIVLFFFFKQKTAYEMRISDRSSDVCSSDLWLGVGDDGEVVVLALEDLLQPLRPFELEDIGLHADRCELRGDHLAAAPGVGWRRQLEGEREAVGVAGLRQQRLGLPRLIGIVELGRASCRERVCQYVSTWVAGGQLKKKENDT